MCSLIYHSIVVVLLATDIELGEKAHEERLKRTLDSKLEEPRLSQNGAYNSSVTLATQISLSFIFFIKKMKVLIRTLQTWIF